MDIIAEFVAELMFQLLAEFFIELGWRSMGESIRSPSRAHPVLASIGIAFLGMISGIITSLIWPTRIIEPFPVEGLSLILSPLIAGTVMERYGQWRENQGGARSYMATFWGGAIFAFSMALVRYLWVGS